LAAIQAAAATGRLVVVHWLDSLQGAPTPTGIAALTAPYAGYDAFICGPDPYMTVVRQALSQLSVPAAQVHVERFLSLAENPFEATEPRGMKVIGMTALDLLRIEGGFIIGGVEYDPSVSPYECGLGWSIALDKGDFQGRAGVEVHSVMEGPH